MHRLTAPRLLPLTCAIIFLLSVVLTLIGPMVPRIAARHHHSTIFPALVVAGHPIGSAIAALFTLWFSRRFGMQVTVLLGAAIMLVGTAFFLAPWSGIWPLLARIGDGAGATVIWQAIIAWAVTEEGMARRGRTLGLIFASSTLGGLVGPPLAALALGTSRLVLLVPCVIMVALTVATLRLESHVFTAPTSVRYILSAYRSRAGVAALALTTMPGWLTMALNARAPLVLAAAGLGAAAISAVLAGAAAAGALANPLFGHVHDVGHRRQVLKLGLAGASASLVLLALTQAAAGTIIAVVGINVALAGVSLVAGGLMAGVSAKAELDQSVNMTIGTLIWAPSAISGALLAGALPSVRLTMLLLAGLPALCLLAIAAERVTRRYRLPTQAAARDQ